LRYDGSDGGLKAVIFDMDNTLFDFIEAQLMACKAVTNRLGVGNKYDLFDYFLRDPRRFEDLGNIADYMRDRGLYDRETYGECCRIYDEAKMEAIVPYPGVKEVLEGLRARGVRLAVVTNASNGNALARLNRAGLAGFFDAVVSADMTGRMKPEPDSVILALKMLDLRPEEAVLVGDSMGRDIAAGRRLGTLTAYAEYGDRNLREKKSWEADYILEDVRDLVGLVDTLSIEENTTVEHNEVKKI